jgi:3-methylfumaryl-CoA hydratase
MSDTKPFAEWVGRRSESEDVITPRLAASYNAIFAPNLAPVSEGVAPLGMHWCLSPAIAPMWELGPDGHPAKNRDLPPVPQPRRMWAGGSIETLGEMRIGDNVRRISTIADITAKQGRTGELWFVAVDHEYVTPRGVAVRERHNIVYREAAKTGGQPANATGTATAAPVERTSDCAIVVETTPTLLFRYSAVTFSGHRIHYDLPYARDVEGYGGLVVHGPIQATLLYNLAATALGRPPARFEYRGVAPAIAGSPLHVRGDSKTGNFWTQGGDGTVYMESSAA